LLINDKFYGVAEKMKQIFKVILVFQIPMLPVEVNHGRQMASKPEEKLNTKQIDGSSASGLL
jgi:hypothetical protein